MDTITFATASPIEKNIGIKR